MDMKIAKQRYNEQKYRAKSRGIEWQLTFMEWCFIWQQSGKWDQRGCRKGQYVMSRIGDQGPYAVWNVFIQLHEENAKEGLVDKKRLAFSSQSVSYTHLTLPTNREV